MRLEFDGRLLNPEALRLVGAHELRPLLGDVSRQRVYQLTARKDFPKPVANLRQGKVWLGEDIDAWIAAYRHRQTARADDAW